MDMLSRLPGLQARVRRNTAMSPVSPVPAAPSAVSTAAGTPLRHDWSRAEVRALFDLPFPVLLQRAADVHRAHFDPTQVQVSTLLSIKTGGCPEDCGYCPQAA